MSGKTTKRVPKSSTATAKTKAKSAGLWKLRAKIEKLSDWNMHYFTVPKKIFEEMGGKYKVRLKCRIEKNPPFSCGLMPLGGGIPFIMLSKKKMKDLELIAGKHIQVFLEIDSSKYGMDMPAELKEVLKQDSQGKKRFQKLTPGKQRNIIHYVSSVSDTEKKVDRAVTLIENLKRTPIGKESLWGLLGKNSLK
jgi:hypothetical protein